MKEINKYLTFAGENFLRQFISRNVSVTKDSNRGVKCQVYSKLQQFRTIEWHMNEVYVK